LYYNSTLMQSAAHMWRQFHLASITLVQTEMAKHIVMITIVIYGI